MAADKQNYGFFATHFLDKFGGGDDKKKKKKVVKETKASLSGNIPQKKPSKPKKKIKKPEESFKDTNWRAGKNAAPGSLERKKYLAEAKKREAGTVDKKAIAKMEAKQKAEKGEKLTKKQLESPEYAGYRISAEEVREGKEAAKKKRLEKSRADVEAHGGKAMTVKAAEAADVKAQKEKKKESKKRAAKQYKEFMESTTSPQSKLAGVITDTEFKKVKKAEASSREKEEEASKSKREAKRKKERLKAFVEGEDVQSKRDHKEEVKKWFESGYLSKAERQKAKKKLRKLSKGKA